VALFLGAMLSSVGLYQAIVSFFSGIDRFRLAGLFALHIDGDGQQAAEPAAAAQEAMRDVRPGQIANRSKEAHAHGIAM
jgi:hypothetical protein